MNAIQTYDIKIKEYINNLFNKFVNKTVEKKFIDIHNLNPFMNNAYAVPLSYFGLSKTDVDNFIDNKLDICLEVNPVSCAISMMFGPYSPKIDKLLNSVFMSKIAKIFWKTYNIRVSLDDLCDVVKIPQLNDYINYWDDYNSKYSLPSKQAYDIFVRAPLFGYSFAECLHFETPRIIIAKTCTSGLLSVSGLAQTNIAFIVTDNYVFLTRLMTITDTSNIDYYTMFTESSLTDKLSTRYSSFLNSFVYEKPYKVLYAMYYYSNNQDYISGIENLAEQNGFLGEYKVDNFLNALNYKGDEPPVPPVI